MKMSMAFLLSDVLYKQTDECYERSFQTDPHLVWKEQFINEFGQNRQV